MRYRDPTPDFKIYAPYSGNHIHPDFGWSFHNLGSDDDDDFQEQPYDDGEEGDFSPEPLPDQKGKGSSRWRDDDF